MKVKFSSKRYRRFMFTMQFVRYVLINRILKQNDNILVVSGRRGSGKTSLCIKLFNPFTDMTIIEELHNKEDGRLPERMRAEEHIKLEGFQPFDMERDIVFQKDQLQENTMNFRRGFILADEVINSAGRRNSMTKINKELHKILTVNRKNCNTIAMCIPSIEDLDQAILQYVTMWIHVSERGVASVMLPNQSSIFGRKSWDLLGLKKIHEKFLEEHPRETSVPSYLYPNFVGHLSFGKLPKKLEEKYLEIAHRKKNIDTKKEINEKKAKQDTLTEENKTLLNEIAQQLISGTLADTSDYYANCHKFGVKRDSFNRKVNDVLIELGIGDTVAQLLKKNRDKRQVESRNTTAFYKNR